IDVLTGMEHHRKLARKMRHNRLRQSAAKTEVSLEELPYRPPSSNLLGPQQHMAFPMQPVGDRGRAGSFDGPVDAFACCIDRGIAKRRQGTIPRNVCSA